MDWVEKELWAAAITGACTGVGVMVPTAIDRSVSWWGFLVLPAFVGGVVGLLVGVIAVGGGRYAQWTDRAWPARSNRTWRHRFAVCTAGSVMLVVAGLLCWVVVAAPDISLGTDGSPELLIVVAAIATVSYLFACVFAPPREPRTSQSPPG